MAIKVDFVVADTSESVIFPDAVGLQSPDSGALVLLRAGGVPLAAFAPGTWFAARVVSDAEV